MGKMSKLIAVVVPSWLRPKPRKTFDMEEIGRMKARTEERIRKAMLAADRPQHRLPMCATVKCSTCKRDNLVTGMDRISSAKMHRMIEGEGSRIFVYFEVKCWHFECRSNFIGCVMMEKR